MNRRVGQISFRCIRAHFVHPRAIPQQACGVEKEARMTSGLPSLASVPLGGRDADYANSLPPELFGASRRFGSLVTKPQQSGDTSSLVDGETGAVSARHR